MLNNGKVRIFADDTSIFFHSDSIEDIIYIAKNIMSQLTSWFNANKQIMPEVIILGCIYALPAYRDLMRAEGPKHIPIY